MSKQHENEYFDAIDTVRRAARWTATAFAGIAAVVVGTSPLTHVGFLAAWSSRWWAALCSALLALVAVSVVIYVAVRILEPVENDIKSIRSETRIMEYLKDHPPALLRKKYENVAAADRYQNLLTDLTAHQAEPRIMDAVETAGLWVVVSRRWFWFRIIGGIAAITAVLAILVFSWAANPPESKVTGQTQSLVTDRCT